MWEKVKTETFTKTSESLTGIDGSIKTNQDDD